MERSALRRWGLAWLMAAAVAAAGCSGGEPAGPAEPPPAPDAPADPPAPPPAGEGTGAPDGGSPAGDADGSTPPAPIPGLSDPAATPLTRAVYQSLRGLREGKLRRVLFGQQEADTSSRGANGLEPLRSDVEAITGRFPAVVSYELYNAYPGSLTAFDAAGLRAGLPKLRARLLDKYRRGALTSLVWHMRCPKQRPSDNDAFAPGECPASYTLAELLAAKPGGGSGVHAAAWSATLDALAELFLSLRTDDGELLPVLFRPFHEVTGDWFWWGRTNPPAVYRAAYRAMVEGLRARGVHNVLWVYCPDKPTDPYQVGQGGDFRAYYPGDDVVDVVGFDRYDDNSGAFAPGFAADLKAVGSFATEHRKVAAVTEVGRNFAVHGLAASPAWFSRALFGPVLEGPDGAPFVYVALWRNAPWEKYMAEPGDGALADDLRALALRPGVLFADPSLRLYGERPAS